MILRNIAVRHGRAILASPISRSCCRALSTETTTTPASTSVPLSADGIAPPPVSLEGDGPQAQRQRIPHDDPVPSDHQIFQTIKKRTGHLGSSVQVRYDPDKVLDQPPEDASLELLMASQVHMGHHTSLWNPANSRYIYGVREGIHIISLETTAAHLRRAARVVEEVAYRGGLILFVGTRPGHMPIVTRAAQVAGACHLFQKWRPGTITNRDLILKSAPIRVVDENDQDLEAFRDHTLTCRPLVPDLVVCLNPLENFPLLRECGQENIPTIGIIDTDADPSWVTYTIPANDDSLRGVALMAMILGQAGKRGNKRRLEAAKIGQVTWKNPTEIERFVGRKLAMKAAEDEKLLGKVRSQERWEMGPDLNTGKNRGRGRGSRRSAFEPREAENMD